MARCWAGSRLGAHLCPDVLEAGRADETEADEEDVRLRVRERPETVVVLLSSRVPQAEVDRLAIDHHVRGAAARACQGRQLPSRPSRRAGARARRTH